MFDDQTLKGRLFQTDIYIYMSVWNMYVYYLIFGHERSIMCHSRNKMKWGLLETIRPVVTPDGNFYCQVLQAIIKSRGL